MVTLRPVVTDEFGARVLSSLIDRAATDGEFPAVLARTPSAAPGLVVKLRTAISAGSTVQVAADIMKLVNGAWVASGQTVLVRSANGAAVATTNRHVARRVSTFGWCVVET